VACNSVFCSFVDFKFEPMDPDAQRQKRRENVVSSLNAAIETLNLAKEISSITPAKAVFGSVGVILTMIKVDLVPLLLR
jgi:hypothetical protein